MLACMRPFKLFLCLCLATPALSQGDPNLGQSAVSAVLDSYSLNPLVPVPGTGKPLPAGGEWSIRTVRPESCPHDDSPCARVVYTVADIHVDCEWTVVRQGSSHAIFLDQNEDASRYLLRNLPFGNLASLILSDPQPAYPPIARAAHVSGSVVVRSVVSRDGIVTPTAVVSGPEMLRSATLVAAKRWTFHPLMVGTHTAPFVADLKADFRVDDTGEGGTVIMRPWRPGPDSISSNRLD